MKRFLRILTVTLLVTLVCVTTGWTPSVSINGNGFLSISLSEVAIAAQIDNSQQYQSYKATYVPPTVTKVKDNLFEINYSGAHHKVRIGTGTSRFISRMSFGAWDNECLVQLEMANITGNLGKATLTGTGENAVITVENNAWKLVYNPVPPTSGFNEYGGIDYSLTIKRRTSYNSISFTYTGTNVEAYWQPPLTQEFTSGWSDEFQCEIFVTETQVTRVDDGTVLVERPAHVVNSIVFYHASKGGLVTQIDADRGISTGKIGQLYALRVTDANNNQTWAGWTKTSDTLITLTVPLAFLQNAVYPVVIAPTGDTFGYTSTCATTWSRMGYNLMGGQFTGAGGTATSITTYMKASALSPPDTFMKGVLVLQSTEVIISNGVGSPGDAGLSADGAHWVTSTFSINPTISAVDYYLMYLCDMYYTFYYDSAVGYSIVQDDSNNYTTPTNPTDATVYSGYKTPIYCTYTPAASFDISNTPSSKAFGIVAVSSTYYAYGSAPSNPIVDGECTFAVTNNAASACDLDMKVSDFTGGVGWNIGAPGANQARITAYYSGQNPASGLVLANTDAEFYDALAASAHIHWDFKLETPTSVTDGVAKSATLTITAVAED